MQKKKKKKKKNGSVTGYCMGVEIYIYIYIVQLNGDSNSVKPS